MHWTLSCLVFYNIPICVSIWISLSFWKPTKIRLPDHLIPKCFSHRAAMDLRYADWIKFELCVQSNHIINHPFPLHRQLKGVSVCWKKNKQILIRTSNRLISLYRKWMIACPFWKIEDYKNWIDKFLSWC